MRPLIIILFLLITSLGLAQTIDSNYIQVHFLYGSRPYHKYLKTEKRWFGGVKGGHVGVAIRHNEIVNFSPKGRFHIFASRRNRHSTFTSIDSNSFYSCLGGVPDSMKKTIIYIPINASQFQKFDSISSSYLDQTPYDYAFWGTRCAAAAADILGQLGIGPDYGYRANYLQTFYPKRLRKRLLRMARQNGWKVTRQEGSSRRRWESD